MLVKSAKLVKIAQKLGRYYIYFRRAHTTYLVFVVSLANFIVIQYALLIEKIPILKQVFPTIGHFVLTVLPVYIAVCILVGWLDYRRGLVRTELTLVAQAHPWMRDIARALYLICEGKTEEAKRILEKWCSTEKS